MGIKVKEPEFNSSMDYEDYPDFNQKIKNMKNEITENTDIFASNKLGPSEIYDPSAYWNENLNAIKENYVELLGKENVKKEVINTFELGKRESIN